MKKLFVFFFFTHRFRCYIKCSCGFQTQGDGDLSLLRMVTLLVTLFLWLYGWWRVGWWIDCGCVDLCAFVGNLICTWAGIDGVQMIISVKYPKYGTIVAMLLYIVVHCVRGKLKNCIRCLVLAAILDSYKYNYNFICSCEKYLKCWIFMHF